MSTPSAYLVVSPEMAKFLQDNDKSFKGNSLDPGGVIGWLDGIEIRVGSEPSINTIGRLIKRKENLEAVMTFLDASGFDIDFSDTSEDTVEVEVKYREEDLGIFECSGLLNLKDEIWGIIKYCYDWYINNGTETETERISGYCQPIQNFGRQDEKDRRR